ncbi:MAG: monofunctional biosynthetic peptidoglycan transglycosylase [Bacteroidales bacterium]
MRKFFIWIKRIIVIFFLWSILSVLLFRFIPVPLTPLMLIRCVESVFKGEMPKLKHDWVAFDQISPNIVRAVIASEDNRFLQHNGFDFVELKKAIKENEKRKRPRGASTITQQTAKNVFLWPGHSFIRKGFEAYFTLLIELFWSKERIITVYLNSIEMGKGIYGVQAVAENNFHTTAKKLTKRQAALIASSLPNPIRFNSAQPSAYMLKRTNQIMNLMPKLGPLEFSKEIILK